MAGKKKTSKSTKSGKPVGIALCTPKRLPADMEIQAAEHARRVNPANAPLTARLDAIPSPQFLAFVTQKMWPNGTELPVSFMEPIDEALKTRILFHMNSWNTKGKAHIYFVPASGTGRIRITRKKPGLWSYLGLDCDMIPANEPTMCLQGFTMNTPESEFLRVVQHESGHAIGAPHEHLRRELIGLLDQQKTIAYFQRTQGWSPAETRAQVLTPLEEHSVLATATADGTSIMCYQIPGSITLNGQPIPGGDDLDADDIDWSGRAYPKPPEPPPPPPPDDDTLKAAVRQYADDVMAAADSLWYGLDAKTKKIIQAAR